MQPDQSAELPSGRSARVFLYPFEAQDIVILDKFVKPLYEPSAVPLAMCVGYSCVREGAILRDFHERSYGFNYDAPKVIACNIREFELAGTNDRLDKVYMHPVTGDVRDCFTWMKPLLDLGVTNRLSYDLSYIRNPDLVIIRDWAAVFGRAVEMTSSTGVVVTLIRESDAERFEDLKDYLKDQFQVEPTLVTPTGMDLPGDDIGQHHLLAVFAGRA
jgi:hypothetical protein